LRICEREGCSNSIDPFMRKSTRFCSRSCQVKNLQPEKPKLTRVCLLDGCDEEFETIRNKMFCCNKHRLRYKRLHPDSEFRIWGGTLDNFNKTNNKAGLGTLKVKVMKKDNPKWDGAEHILKSEVKEIFSQHGFSGVATGRVTGPWIDQGRHDRCSMELILHYFPEMKDAEQKRGMKVISCKERNLFFDTMKPYDDEGRLRNHLYEVSNGLQH